MPESQKPARKARFVTPSNLELKRVRTEKDLKDADPPSLLGEPGGYPFIRGNELPGALGAG